MAKSDDENAERFVEYVPALIQKMQTLVKSGFVPEEQIVDWAIDDVEVELGEGDWKARVQAVVRTALDSQIADQEKWSKSTDCDRLDAAFEKIATSNIIARHHYWCCSACGTSAIDNEIHDSLTKYGRHTIGYVYYHEQDTNRAVELDDLHLRYAGTNYSNAQTIEVANIIIAALEEQGLKTNWSGNPDESIRVPISWKRRRTLGQDDSDIAGRGGAHYIAIEPEEAKADPNISEKDKAEIQEWVPIILEHFQSVEPEKIKLEPARLELMKKVFALKSQLAQEHDRPATEDEVAQALGVHRLIVSSIDQLLRYHITELKTKITA